MPRTTEEQKVNQRTVREWLWWKVCKKENAKTDAEGVQRNPWFVYNGPLR